MRPRNLASHRTLSLRPLSLSLRRFDRLSAQGTAQGARRPRLLLPSSGAPPLLPPSPLADPDVDAFCRLLADIILQIIERPNADDSH